MVEESQSQSVKSVLRRLSPIPRLKFRCTNHRALAVIKAIESAPARVKKIFVSPTTTGVRAT